MNMQFKDRSNIISSKARLRYALGIFASILIVGLIYAAWVSLTQYYIPCIFHVVTGLKCPGCGISHLCMSLLRGDLTGAWEANPFIFIIAIPLATIILRRLFLWIRDGNIPRSKAENISLWIMAGGCIIWGIIRNI